jgi:enamine deaminase RidA (YjgF/YER057c/UK114 family)
VNRKAYSTGKPYEASFRHSAAVRVIGDLLFTSGIVAQDDEGALVGHGDVRRQAEVATQNLLDILQAAGTSADYLVKLTVYVTRIDDYLAAREATAPLYTAKPASTLVEIRRLASPDMLVEIEAVSALPVPTADGAAPRGDVVMTGKPWEARTFHAPGRRTGAPLVYTAGITARAPDGSLVGRDDVAAQTEQTTQNMLDALKAAGTRAEDVVKVLLFVRSIDDFMVQAVKRCQPLFVSRPSSTLIEVTRLQDPALLVEIEAVAEVAYPAEGAPA